MIHGDRQDFDHRLGLEGLLGTKEFTLFHCVGCCQGATLSRMLTSTRKELAICMSDLGFS